MSDRITSTRRTVLQLLSGAAIGSAGLSRVAASDQEYDQPAFESSDSTEWIVRLDESDVAKPTSQGQLSPSQRRDAVAEVQDPVVETLQAQSGISVRQRFWAVNAVLVTADELEDPQSEIQALSGVVDVHPNFEVESPEPVDTQKITPLQDDVAVTFGLDQIDAPAVWESFGTRGEGVRVAVLDTGVDPDHPDIELATDGWAEFDETGELLDSDPYDPDGHGTHVSGTVAGGDAAGVAIGVAPEAELMHAKVLDNGGTFAQIISGMQWAAVNEADIINMSLGAPGYVAAFVEPVRNMEDMGVAVISSSGNDGPNTSGSPANVYDSFAIGATDVSEEVSDFSSGERIHAPTVWDEKPSNWPTWYTVPNVSAPGDLVLSSVPGGGYERLSGTSMASPHVAGIAALVLSQDQNQTPEELMELLEDTSIHPGGARYPDTRYGTGITNALNATTAGAQDGALSVSVTYQDEPLPGIDVFTGFGTRGTSTNEGAVRIPHPEGESTLFAEAFGLESDFVSTQVEGTTDVNLELSDSLDVQLLQLQPTDMATDGEFEIVLEAANLEKISIDLAEESDGLDEADITFTAADKTFGPGETTSFEEPISDTVVLQVDIDNAANDGALVLDHEFGGLGETLEVSTGPTTLVEDPANPAFEIVDPNFDETVGAGRRITFQPTIENTGDLTAEQTIVFEVELLEGDGSTFTGSVPFPLELSPGEQEEFDTPVLLGEFPRQEEATQRIITDDEQVEGVFDVLGGAFQLGEVDVPSTLDTGRTVEVNVTVENTGELGDTTQLEFYFEGRLISSTELSVPAEGSEEATFAVETDGLTPGQYDHFLFTEFADPVEGTVTLEEPEIHPSGVSQELFDTVTGDGNLTTGDLNNAVSEWSDNRQINGIPITVGDIRKLVDWWQQQQ